MMLPNKTVTYRESVLSKFPIVLKYLETQRSVTPGALYKKLGKNFSSIHLFIQTLDCLFALKKIQFNDKKELTLC